MQEQILALRCLEAVAQARLYVTRFAFCIQASLNRLLSPRYLQLSGATLSNTFVLGVCRG